MENEWQDPVIKNTVKGKKLDNMCKKVVDKRKTPMYNHLGVKNLSLGVWA